MMEAAGLRSSLSEWHDKWGSTFDGVLIHCLLCHACARGAAMIDNSFDERAPSLRLDDDHGADELGCALTLVIQCTSKSGIGFGFTKEMGPRLGAK